MIQLNPLPASVLDYLQGPSQPEGERNAKLFWAACQFRDAGYPEDAAGAELHSAACLRDGLSDAEVITSIKSAYRKAPRHPISHTYRDPDEGRRPVREMARPEPAPVASYELKGDMELPQPIQGGAAELLRKAFEPGETVGIDLLSIEGLPTSGVYLRRDEWIERLENGVHTKCVASNNPAGAFIRVNPCRGPKNEDVTSYRHVLVEFDNRPLVEQWELITKSGIPCSAVIYSGGKSLHAWVRVNAPSEVEYRAAVKILYEHFKAYGVDKQCGNPSRLSRLPDVKRGDSTQTLLAVGIGKPWSEWTAEKVDADGITDPLDIDVLLDFDPSSDNNCVLGNRWLCRSGSCLWVGQSGLGKSTMAMQAAITWAVGKPLFGIRPAGQLKSLIIQAENDKGDMSEMMQGVVRGMGFELGDTGLRDLLKRQIIIHRDTTHVAGEFARVARRLIDKYKPDLVWVDPLLSYLGGDINSQEVCSKFFRNQLGPISEQTGVIWMLMHHTPKPSRQAADKNAYSGHDYSYLGAGSAEVTNWARAVVILRQKCEGVYELRFPKRGDRAGLCDKDDKPLPKGEKCISLQHGSKGLHWEYLTPTYTVDNPANPEHRKRGRPPKPKTDEPTQPKKRGRPSKKDKANDEVYALSQESSNEAPLHDPLREVVPQEEWEQGAGGEGHGGEGEYFESYLPKV